MEKGIPIHRMARAFAQERCDEVGYRADRLADLIEQGMPLEAALNKTRYRLPTHAQLAVNMNASAPSTGRLLHDTARRHFQIESDARPYLHQLFYLMKVLLVGAFVLPFLAIKIYPVVLQILQDFNVPPNWLLEMTSGLMTGVANNLGLVFWFWILAGILLGVQVFHYLGWTAWEPIVIRRITRRYHASVILRTLACQLNSAVPIQTSLELMGSKYPQRHIRRRLLNSARRISRGASWHDALQSERLIHKSDANVLRAAERVGNLPWAMEETAEGIVRRLRYRIMLWMRVLIPIVIIAMALVVGLCGAAIFSSLTEMVLRVAT